MPPCPPHFFKARLLLSVMFTSALAGCAMGTDYVRPATALPAQHHPAPVAETSETIIQAEWWQLFKDATLNHLVTQMLADNQDLHAALARLAASEAAAREAGAERYPAIGLSANQSRTRTSGETALGQISGSALYPNRRAALSLGYEFDFWGRVQRSNEAARAELLASQFGRDSLQLALVGELIQTYLTLRSDDEQLTITRNLLATHQKSIQIVQARVTAGAASALDLHRAESAFHAAEAQLSQLQRVRALSQNQLGLLTGQPALTLPMAVFKQWPQPPMPPVGLPSALLEARPDVRQAEEKLIAAQARIGVAKAAYFPTIGLTGLYGSESAALAQLFTGGAGLWSAAIGLTMPIFDAGKTSARVAQTTALQAESLAHYRKTVQLAFREVSDALVNLREYTAEDTALSAQATAAQQALRLAQTRYAAGYVGYMDVLDTQRTFHTAQLQQVASRRARLGASVDLFKALGGGWVATP